MKYLFIILNIFSLVQASDLFLEYCSQQEKYNIKANRHYNLFFQQICKNPYERLTNKELEKNQLIDCRNEKTLLLDENILLDNQQALTIKNCNIVLTKTINVIDANLSLINNKIILLSDISIDFNSSSNPASIFAINLHQNTSFRQVTIESNDIFTLISYSVGFIRTLKDHFIRENIKIHNNSFNNFHGVIYLGFVHDSQISNNKFFRNSFGNIVLNNSKKVKVYNNDILFPGNGTSGDGITLNNIKEGLFFKNKIIGGSCYGVAIHGNNEKLKFIENIIADGITSALYFNTNSYSKNILIAKNLFLNNDAYSIGLENNVTVVNLQIKDNIFHQGKQLNIDDEDGSQYNKTYNIYIGPEAIIKNLKFEFNFLMNNFLKVDKRVINYTHIEPYEKLFDKGKNIK